ncbi:MAG TPA: hypothetical protein VE442_16465 [Jatrophihabitans sp.]|jgi:hypothetical protein|nr:hypothetical protein [Jatrophihabitans sp.]
MGVTVIITRDDNGAPQTRETFPEGDKFVIVDGNLNVYSVDGDLLGTFGSGNWLTSFAGDDTVHVETTKPPEDDSSDDFGFGDDSDSDSSSDLSLDSDTDTDTDTEVGTDAESDASSESSAELPELSLDSNEPVLEST